MKRRALSTVLLVIVCPVAAAQVRDTSPAEETGIHRSVLVDESTVQEARVTYEAGAVERAGDTMKYLVLAAFLGGLAPSASAAETPSAVIDREIVAYNARDIDAFMKFYAPECEIVRLTFPEGTGVQDFVVISEVKGGLKTKVWIMVGEKALDKK